MADNIFPTMSFITLENRIKAYKQKPFVVWLIGLSGAGKTTLAYHLEQRLFSEGYYVATIDGDNVRSGLCKDLGFSQEDRTENLRRVAEMVKLFLQTGVICITSFITPKQFDRDMIKNIIGKDYVVDVYLQCSVQECAKRDPKQLYHLAKNKKIANFSGISSKFEEPVAPALIVNTEKDIIEHNISDIYLYLKTHNFL